MTTTCEIPFDITAAGDDVVLFYLYLIEEKCQSTRMAEMLALRQAPRVMTDDVMMGGAPTISDMYAKDPKMTERLCRIAMKKGYKPRHTDFYNSAIATSEGDPAAFLNHGQGRGHIKRTLEQRGMGSNGGLVTVKAREPERDPWDNRVKLAPKIVERIRKQKIMENPNLARKDQRELRQDIVDKHGAQ